MIMRTFYTDGSCATDETPIGGWAFIEINGTQVIAKKSGSECSWSLSANQMELRAAIEAAKTIGVNESATIYSDSQYVVKGITQWIESWQKNNWHTKKNEIVLNQELWKELLLTVENKQINWIWVRSHCKNVFNELVDQMAKNAYLRNEQLHTNDEMKYLSTGDLFHLGDESKKFVAIFNQIKVDEKNGVLAMLLANYPSYEMHFISNEEQTFIVNASKKEKILINDILQLMKERIELDVDKFSANCTHSIKKKHDSAICEICDQSFGWWCPDSPDNCCHYFSENGFIALENGQKVPIPPDHDEKYETDDCCIFCHDPEERK